MDEVLLSLLHCSSTNAKLQNDQFLLAVDSRIIYIKRKKNTNKEYKKKRKGERNTEVQENCTPSHYNYIIKPFQGKTLSTLCLAKAFAIMVDDLLLC
ncbi:hypothetical protein CKAN_01790400 [Cinnamomum micranthum f. kanehirae]|uniref:Uncharacterized protein n=1 Tax=Cinnamomum micranthum f. kanehirae TaxID=337451 RepID=A0A3S4PD93_9MAGN|nr:hypothetical protein CKAN_01790400 [Cinnamomum micranthum f. kanehirae]